MLKNKKINVQKAIDKSTDLINDEINDLVTNYKQGHLQNVINIICNIYNEDLYVTPGIDMGIIDANLNKALKGLLSNLKKNNQKNKITDKEEKIINNSQGDGIIDYNFID